MGADTNTSDIVNGVPIWAWYNNTTIGVNLSNVCDVLYTDKPFVIATTTYSPMTNLSTTAPNNIINVSINLRSYGWVNKTYYNNSAILIFDCSGSMDWSSNTIYPDPNTNGGLPQTGYVGMPPAL